MTNDIFVSPLASLTGDDIQHLCDVAAEEGPRLEFKRALSTSDGRTPDRWMKDQSGIGTSARDDIAREVVAFANAPALFSTIDRDVWDLFGNEVHEPLNVNWATVFEEVGL